MTKVGLTLRDNLAGWSRVIVPLALGLCTLAASAQQPGRSPEKGKLHIYFIDVEGGQSTLFVAPGKHSLLIDTGWPGNGGRDAYRIAQAAKAAGLTKIDYVLLTHYHVDHTGGVPQLVEKIPVGTFIDHGENHEPNDGPTAAAYAGYQKVLATGKYKHIVAKPDDLLPIEGMRVRVVSADGALIQRSLKTGGEPNPYCKVSETRPPDQTENARSIGVKIAFGKVRILDLGDLTWDKEMGLMCPNNRVGRVDLLVVSHHGWYQSSSPALVDEIHPRVAVMDNGAKKGGSAPTVKTIREIPGLAAEYQLHYSQEAGAGNPPPAFLANLQGPEDAGYRIDVVADADGTLRVKNDRTGEVKAYAPGH